MHRPRFVRLIPARLGDEGEDVAYVQRRLGVFPVTSKLDPNTVVRIRGFQYLNGLLVTGELDAETFNTLRDRA